MLPPTHPHHVQAAGGAQDPLTAAILRLGRAGVNGRAMRVASCP